MVSIFTRKALARNFVICIANGEKVLGKEKDDFKRSIQNIEIEQSFVCV